MAALNFPSNPSLNDVFTSGSLSWRWDGDRWVPVADVISTDLSYTAATRVIASSTGTDATLPLVTSGDAGLAPASGGGIVNFLRADGTWAAPPGYTEPGAGRFYTFNDFVSAVATPYWILAGSGAGAAVTAAASPDGSGVGWVVLTTGTTTTGRTRVMSQRLDTINFSNGAARARAGVRIDTLSDGTETYTARAGFIDNDTGETTDGAFFRYTHSVNGGRWQAITRAASVETAVDTGITVAANTNYAFDVRVSGGTATFYIGGVLVATISTNVPSGSARTTSYGVNVIKSAGITPRTLQLDYCWVEQILTGRL